MDHTRSRLDVRRPRYLDDFLVNIPPRRLSSLTLHGHSNEGAAFQPPAPVITADPVGPAPQNLSSEAVMSALQEMKEENNQLRRDMQILFNSLSLRSAPQPQHLDPGHILLSLRTAPPHICLIFLREHPLLIAIFKQ